MYYLINFYTNIPVIYNILYYIVLYYMIYLYTNINNNDPSEYWQYPFYLFLKCLSIIFDKHNINHKLISPIEEINFLETDCLITFQPFYTSIDNIKCKIIYINSESLYINQHIRPIENQVQNKNIVNIWDYNLRHVKCLNKYNKTYYVPFTYHSFLETFYKQCMNSDNEIYGKIQNTDFLLFGAGTDRRFVIIDRLKSLGYSARIWWTNDIKELIFNIQKTKIIIIVHAYEEDLCIDFYRLSWLLSNKIFVIHELPNIDAQDSSFDKIIYSDHNNFVDTCVKYIKMTKDERDEICDNIYNQEE